MRNETDKKREDSFKAFIAGLEKLSNEHGVVLATQGGVFFMKNDEHVEYDCDHTSGDINAQVIHFNEWMTSEFASCIEAKKEFKNGVLSKITGLFSSYKEAHAFFKMHTKGNPVSDFDIDEAEAGGKTLWSVRIEFA